MRVFDANAPSRGDGNLDAKRLGKGLIASVLAAAAWAAVACGGGEQEARAPVQREGPEEQILRVAVVWDARWAEQGFRTAPSPISVFDNRVTSRITFTPGTKTAKERLTVEGTFKLSDGTSYACRAEVETTLAVAFGDRAGEAAVQLSRGGLRVPRRCDRPAFPEPELVVPAARARFALRGDKLVGFDPPTERREYLPAD